MGSTAATTSSRHAKTLEPVAHKGPALSDLTASFDALQVDAPGVVDGVWDQGTQPLAEEPARVLADLDRIRGPWG